MPTTTPARSTQQYAGMPVYALRDVLARVPLPPSYKLDQVSNKWRCIIAPGVDSDTPEEQEAEALAWIEKGVPCFLPATAAKAVHDTFPANADALAFLTVDDRNVFTKPQIAVRTGWGAPGTLLESSEFHKLVRSFSEVLDHSLQSEAQTVEARLTTEAQQELAAVRARAEAEADTDTAQPDAPAPSAGDAPLEDDPIDADPETVSADVAATARRAQEDVPLEIQLFHRPECNDTHGTAEVAPHVPALGRKLLWPTFVEDGVACEEATVLSQQGSRRHWHLNDCGEFQLEAALPLRQDNTPGGTASRTYTPLQKGYGEPTEDAAWATIDRHLLRGAACASETSPEKLGYPVKLSISGMKGTYDWFLHDDEAITSGKVVTFDLFNMPDAALPVDERTLPLLVVSVVMSGGRPLLTPPNTPTMSVTLNDGVLVEQRRLAHLWLDELSFFLQRCSRWVSAPHIYDYVDQDLQDSEYVAGKLIPLLMHMFQCNGGSDDFHEGLRRRVAASLLAIASHEKHYGLTGSSRQSLLRYLQAEHDDLRRTLNSPVPFGLSQASVRPILLDFLAQYWSIQHQWPKPGCVFEVPSWQTSRSEALFIPVVYHARMPFYGTEKLMLEETVQEYFEMHNLAKKQRVELLAYLKTRKEAKDDLLDELF